MPKREEIAIKKWFFGGKKWVIDLKNREMTTKLERQNGAKCSYFA